MRIGVDAGAEQNRTNQAFWLFTSGNTRPQGSDVFEVVLRRSFRNRYSSRDNFCQLRNVCILRCELPEQNAEN